MDFHVAVDGRQEGPLSEEEVRVLIRSRAVKPTDHCWTEGWENWRLMQETFGEEFRAVQPAPLASWESLTGAGVDDLAADGRRLPVRRDRTSAGIFGLVAIFGGLVLAGGLLWYLLSGDEQPPPPTKSAVITGAHGELLEQQFSGSNLEQLVAACLVYAEANGGRLPSYSMQLRPLFGSRFAAVMDVPETPEREQSGYVVRMGLDTSMPGNTPVIIEAGTRPDGTRGVAYLDGTVKVLRRTDPELKRAVGR